MFGSITSACWLQIHLPVVATFPEQFSQWACFFRCCFSINSLINFKKLVFKSVSAKKMYSTNLSKFLRVFSCTLILSFSKPIFSTFLLRNWLFLFLGRAILFFATRRIWAVIIRSHSYTIDHHGSSIASRASYIFYDEDSSYWTVAYRGFFLVYQTFSDVLSIWNTQQTIWQNNEKNLEHCDIFCLPVLFKITTIFELPWTVHL